MHDKEFRILKCNRAYERRAGIPPDEIIGRPYYEIFPRSPSPMPSCLRALDNEEEEQEELEVGVHIYRSRSFPVRDEHDAKLYSVHILEDITERKQAAETLQAREAYLTSIIENEPGLVWLKDTKGRFLATNNAFAVSCGRETQDIVGKTDFDIWPRETAEKYIADDSKVMQAGRRTDRGRRTYLRR
jgi:PAS domain S-box-containing protein